MLDFVATPPNLTEVMRVLHSSSNAPTVFQESSAPIPGLQHPPQQHPPPLEQVVELEEGPGSVGAPSVVRRQKKPKKMVKNDSISPFPHTISFNS